MGLELNFNKSLQGLPPLEEVTLTNLYFKEEAQGFVIWQTTTVVPDCPTFTTTSFPLLEIMTRPKIRLHNSKQLCTKTTK